MALYLKSRFANLGTHNMPVRVNTRSNHLFGPGNIKDRHSISDISTENGGLSYLLAFDEELLADKYF